MRLTSFTDYGLRMLMLMAGSPDRAFSTAQMAEDLNLSRNHLSKIMQRLSRAGIIETRRGGGGGAILAKDPGSLKLGQIIRLLEEDHALVECFSDGRNACTLDGRCGLKTRLRTAEAAFLADLDRSTLADISI
ncbi:Rrf2 family transcriptional regulator [Rhodobacteraceae bacterium N5(2021)]|uniref:Rrf2 family transcriptional regulator n=1 Tax=Gymnodinialimonas phycosphaerae TaxID=2841589 RepID=A0A975TXZ8_9RHOB|nr:Rrf2 family transcriptional regulator [Gymnodinialimonas phycosphaerae]MBY4891946.1 Rrf2 family transcriptional regulator [Gymnodinialimonas phycosphaerae]